MARIGPVPQRLIDLVSSQRHLYPRVSIYVKAEQIEARILVLLAKLEQHGSSASSTASTRALNEFKALSGKLLMTKMTRCMSWVLLGLSLQLTDEPRGRWGSAAEFNHGQDVSIASYLHVYDTTIQDPIT